MLIWILAFTMSIATPGPTQWWTPQVGDTWAIQFTDPEIATDLAVDVIDLDGFDTDATTVADLQFRGARVLCYIDVGTWEDWRPDADAYPTDILGNAWDEWEGERYVDIRRLDVLGPILEARMDMCLAKGFDGIEPDNIDTYQTDTGFPLTEADQVAFSRWLAGAAHHRGPAIGQKNIGDLTSQLVDHFDFAVTEDCFVDDWCDQMKPYIDAGKPVFAIEYTDVGADLDAICPRATNLGFSVVLKHRNLDAWAQWCR